MAAYLDTVTESWAGLTATELAAIMTARKEAARKVSIVPRAVFTHFLKRFFGALLASC